MLSPNFGWQIEYRWDKKLSNGNAVGVKARYNYIYGSLGGLWVRFNDGSKGAVGLGDNINQLASLSLYYTTRFM